MLEIRGGGSASEQTEDKDARSEREVKPNHFNLPGYHVVEEDGSVIHFRDLVQESRKSESKHHHQGM